MRLVTLAIVIAAIATPALAADLPSSAAAPIARQGDMLRDANNVRLSNIESVNRDGSVGIIFNGHYVTLPATSLTTANGKLATSLTKAQVGAIN